MSTLRQLRRPSSRSFSTRITTHRNLNPLDKSAYLLFLDASDDDIILIKIMDRIKLIVQPSHSTSFVLEDED